MAFFDSAADIKIYNYKTREIFSEKCLMAFHKGTNTVAAVGEECTNFSPNDDRVDLCLPIVMGKLDCAIEIGKDDKYQYARYAYEQLKKDYKRWGYDMDVIKDFH